jgi:GNAT superfamily N-acetyltransferase
VFLRFDVNRPGRARPAVDDLQGGTVARALVDVRPVSVEDLPSVLELWAEGAEEINRTGRAAVPADQISSRLAEAMATGQIEILLARNQGRPAGFLVLRESSLGFLVDQVALYVDQLFVAPEFRRHGVARAMLSHVATRAERSGAEQIVSSVTPWARETHRFFARLGFAPVTVRRSVTPSVLRRRLAGDRHHRHGLEDLLSRRRSLRARARRQPGLAMLSQPPRLDVGSDFDDPNAQLA